MELHIYFYGILKHYKTLTGIQCGHGHYSICIWLAYEAHVITLHFFYSTFPYPFLTEKYEINLKMFTKETNMNLF